MKSAGNYTVLLLLGVMAGAIVWMASADYYDQGKVASFGGLNLPAEIWHYLTTAIAGVAPLLLAKLPSWLKPIAATIGPILTNWGGGVPPTPEPIPIPRPDGTLAEFLKYIADQLLRGLLTRDQAEQLVKDGTKTLCCDEDDK